MMRHTVAVVAHGILNSLGVILSWIDNYLLLLIDRAILLREILGMRLEGLRAIAFPNNYSLFVS